MSDPFIGEIRMFGGNYAPRGWYFCMGAYLSIAQYQELFSVILNTYGGNGQTEFRLPNLCGAAPMHWGNSQGPGLSPHYLGQYEWNYQKIIHSHNMPSHTHAVRAENEVGSTPTPSDTTLPALAQTTTGPVPARARDMYSDADQTSQVQLNPEAVSTAGPPNGQPMVFPNYQPYQVCSFIINYNGIYPPRN